MKRLIEFCINNTFAINLISFAILVLGLVAVFSMPITLIPPMEFKSIQVGISLPGANAHEVEEFVTQVVENGIKDVPNLKRFVSTSRSGYSEISLYYPANYSKMEDSLGLVSNRVQSLKNQLPEEIKDIEIHRNVATNEFLYYLGVENFNHQNEAHASSIKKLADELRRVKGVSKVETGVGAKNIEVLLKPSTLAKYQLKMSQIQEAIRSHLALIPVGRLDLPSEEYLISVQSNSVAIDEVSNILIRINDERIPVRLGELATIRYAKLHERSFTYINGNPSTYIHVEKDISSDAIDLKAKTWALVEAFNQKSADLKIVNLVDGPHFIEQQLNSLKKSGIVGFILVSIVLTLFMSWRAALMAIAGVPIAYLGTLVILHAMGINFDIISVIGMIIIVGMLVDDAIVVTESFERLRTLGLTRKQAALEAASSLLKPVTGTVLTTIIAFVPMLLIKSEMGEVLKAIPLIVIFALLLSWAECFFILPNHLAGLAGSGGAPPAAKLMQALESRYSRHLKGVLKYRYFLAAFLFFVVLPGSIFVATKLEQNWNLNIGSEKVTIFMETDGKPSLQTTRKKSLELLSMIQKENQWPIENTELRVGNVWMKGHVYKGPEYAKLSLYIERNHQHPTRIKNEIREILSPKMEGFKSAGFKQLEIEVERYDSDKEQKGMLSVETKGTSTRALLELEASLDKIILPLRGIESKIVSNEKMSLGKTFAPNLIELKDFLLTRTELGTQIRNSIGRDTVLETFAFGEKTNVLTTFLSEPFNDEANLQNLYILTGHFTTVPLWRIGKWSDNNLPAEIKHTDGFATVKYDYKIEPGANLADIQKNAEAALVPFQSQIPAKLSVVKQSEEEKESQSWALKIALACALGIFLVLALTTNSLLQTLMVALPIPFGIVGVMVALYIHGQTLGLMALIGLVGIMGVGVNSSIVVLDQFNRLKKGLLADREAIIESFTYRLRPIMLTAVTTIVGVFPMAYGVGGEAGFTQPLGFSLGWGLLTVALFTLYGLPACLAILCDVETKFRSFRRKPPVAAGLIQEEEPRSDISDSFRKEELTL